MCKNTTISRESKGLAPQNAISLQMQPCAVASQNNNPAGVQPMPSPPYAGVAAAVVHACDSRHTNHTAAAVQPAKVCSMTSRSVKMGREKHFSRLKKHKYQ